MNIYIAKAVGDAYRHPNTDDYIAFRSEQAAEEYAQRLHEEALEAAADDGISEEQYALNGDTFDIAVERLTQDVASELFYDLNNAGKGDPADPTGERIISAGNDKEVDVYDEGDRLVIVGDANGPWAVSVEIR